MEETNTKRNTQKQSKTKKEKIYEKITSWLQKQVGYYMKRLTIQKRRNGWSSIWCKMFSSCMIIVLS